MICGFKKLSPVALVLLTAVLIFAVSLVWEGYSFQQSKREMGMLNELPLSSTEVFRNATVWAAIYATAFGSATSFIMVIATHRKALFRQSNQEQWRN